MSASNFLAGWLLIRRTSEVQYGYYVLVFNSLLLLTTLQGSFMQAQMVVRMTRLDGSGRAQLVGSLMRELRILLRVAGIGVLVTVSALWFAQLIDTALYALLVCGTVAALATLMREYFRMVLFADRRPQAVLVADLCYGAILIGGTAVASFASTAAVFASLTIGAAAVVSMILLSKAVGNCDDSIAAGPTRILREFVPLGTWSVSGAAAHWALSQGYSFIVAGALSVQAVAAIAATRLLLMPLNLLSVGLSTQLFPLTADWVHRLGVRAALHRLALVSLSLVAFACCYFVLIWIARDWIFRELLHKEFEQRDVILLLWFGAFVLMLVRDQLVKLLAARERFPVLAMTTFASAVLSLAFGYGAIPRFGAVGAVAGIVLGELANIIGIVVLTFRELKRGVVVPA